MKKNHKFWTAFLAAALTISLFTACGGSGSSASAPSGGSGAVSDAGAEKTYNITYLSKDMAQPYAIWLANSLTQIAEQDYPDFDITLLDQQQDPSKGVAMIEQAINQQVDGIIIQKAGGYDTDDLFRSVADAGIPLVTVNIPVDDGVSSNVACSNYELGETVGSYAREQIPENAKVLVLRGNPGDLEEERWQGFKESLFDQRPDLEILDTQIAYYDKAKAIAISDDWLQRFPEIDAVVSMNDGQALGFIESCKANGRDLSDIQIYGVDGLADGCLAVEAGEMTATVVQNATEQARHGLRIMHELLTGESEGPVDYIVPAELINKDNIDEWIAFHKEIGMIE